MKTGAIVAEYNPFHKGHQYQLEHFRKISDLDYIIVIMSGNFTQRGEPAWMPKHLRAKMALLGGADLVLELPAYYATGSAHIFAEGAIAHFNALGCVDELCFGCEMNDDFISHQNKLAHTADILINEPPLFKEILSAKLKQGLSYPAARADALKTLLPDSDILFKPNNILALEYMIALKKTNSKIKPVPIRRQGPGYHSIETNHEFSSASALRKAMNAQIDLDELVGLPSDSLKIIQEHYHSSLPITLDDFSSMFGMSFLNASSNLNIYADMTEEIAHRMECHFHNYSHLPSFLLDIKTKAYTYSRLCRCATHILTNQRKDVLNQAKLDGCAYYARVLGFRKTASPLLSMIKKNGTIPLISKMANYQQNLIGNGLSMIETDIFASNIYRTATQMKYGKPLKNEFNENIVII